MGIVEKMTLKLHYSLTQFAGYEIELCAFKMEHKGSMNKPNVEKYK